jgi:lysophospholipase L1-like esterase
MNKTIAACLSAALLAACGGGGGGNGIPIPSNAPGPMANIANPTDIVEMYGDSTTLGVGADAQHSEPAWLQTIVPSGVLVSNQGVGSTTAAQLLNGTDGVHQAFAQAMAASHANIITINFGMNDVLRGGTPEQFAANLGALVDAATAAGKQVVLQEPNPSCDSARAALPQYVAQVDAVAAAKGIQVVRQYGAYADWKAHESDCVHPDATYYQVKAQNTFQTIAPIITALTAP